MSKRVGLFEDRPRFGSDGQFLTETMMYLGTPFTVRRLSSLLLCLGILVGTLFVVPASKAVFAMTDHEPACSIGLVGTGYELPWKYCRWKQVTQGWGGSYSHYYTQMWYAYDFGLCQGTAVRAARAGTVG